MGLSVQFISLGVLTWLFWRIIKGYISASCLDHIPGPKPFSFLSGHLGELTSSNYWPFLRDLSENYGGVIKMWGFLGSKYLYVSDPAALNTILVKDPTAFEEAPEYLAGNTLMFGKGITSVTGSVHRKQRKLLNPAFSPANMRQLAPLFLNIAETLRNVIAADVKGNARSMNIAAWTARGAPELVRQGTMGYSFDPLTNSTPNEYATVIKALMPTVFSVGLPWFFCPWLIKLGPPKFRRFLLNLYPFEKVQKLKRVIDHLWKKSEDIVEERKAAMESGAAGGKDIMSLLLRADMEAAEEDRLPYDELVAQVNTIVFAAVDTTSTSLSRLLHTLVEHPEAQEKLRKEIHDFRGTGEELTYDTLNEFRYLDAVCRETLRVYPPTLSMYRVTQRDIVLPLLKPVNDICNKPMTEVPITKGTIVSMGIYKYNRSKDVWGEDANEWKPERWLNPLPESAKNSCGGSFHNMMTFAGGPRSCIGFKYAELELKVFLFFLIESFKFKPGDNPIVWNTSFAVYPAVSRESRKTEMHLHPNAPSPNLRQLSLLRLASNTPNKQAADHLRALLLDFEMGSSSQNDRGSSDVPPAIWGVVDLISRELQATKDELQAANEKLKLYWPLEEVRMLDVNKVASVHVWIFYRRTGCFVRK
ncbi:hypothetical protein EUX98_g6891 [Antrodiella citrinella]|uniref:Cytochrome P450 n=1 Tax=Antrodiella citrinella TaxID=2447956 RepID=A0A4S4MVC2_9APHY|nr:hypothetical protein EUX98_g6891 [Antrodiella citrinella]